VRTAIKIDGSSQRSKRVWRFNHPYLCPESFRRCSVNGVTVRVTRLCKRHVGHRPASTPTDAPASDPLWSQEQNFGGNHAIQVRRPAEKCGRLWAADPQNLNISAIRLGLRPVAFRPRPYLRFPAPQLREGVEQQIRQARTPRRNPATRL
jgi:hypothetical protein